MKLQIELSTLEKQVNEFVAAFDKIEAFDFTNDQELDSSKKTFVEICTAIESFLAKSISPSNNDHYASFKKGNSDFRNESLTYSFERRNKELLFKTKERKTSLQRIYKTISISDSLLGKVSDKALAARKSFSIRDKKTFILEKLFALNDGWYYSVKSICDGNNIHLSRLDEAINIAQKLEKESLIEIFKQDNRDALVRLTLEGQEYVEDIISQRLKMEGTVSKIKQELGHSEASLSVSAIKDKLKDLLVENKFKEVLEKLDLILEEDADIRMNLMMLMGRNQSMESKRINGLLSDADFFLYENKIRFDLMSVIESISKDAIKG